MQKLNRKAHRKFARSSCKSHKQSKLRRIGVDKSIENYIICVFSLHPSSFPVVGLAASEIKQRGRAISGEVG